MSKKERTAIRFIRFIRTVFLSVAFFNSIYTFAIVTKKFIGILATILHIPQTGCSRRYQNVCGQTGQKQISQTHSKTKQSKFCKRPIFVKKKYMYLV